MENTCITKDLTGRGLAQILEEKYLLSVRKYSKALGITRQPIDQFIKGKTKRPSAEVLRKIQEFDNAWEKKQHSYFEVNSQEKLVVMMYRELESHVKDLSPLNFANKLIAHQGSGH